MASGGCEDIRACAVAIVVEELAEDVVANEAAR
jgi:hypothetical protein